MSYDCSRRQGVLDSKKVLRDTSEAEVTALGVQSGLSARDSAGLSLQVILEDRVLLIPADIIIYAGGDERGSNVAPDTNLPEPGFFVVLPLEAERALREKTGAAEQIDLSGYLTFTDSENSIWKLEPFSDTYSKAHGSFLYRLVPQRTNGGQDGIQM